MLIPNTHRVLIKPLKNYGVISSGGIVMAGATLDQETLFLGEIVHPGDSQFKQGDKVYYSEYSMSNVTDVGDMYRSGGDIKPIDYVIVARDDIMAYDSEGFDVDTKKEKMVDDAKKEAQETAKSDDAKKQGVAEARLFMKMKSSDAATAKRYDDMSDEEILDLYKTLK